MKAQKSRRRKKSHQKKSSASKESSHTSINDLPVSILLHILSFLPTATAVKTTAIAPAWRNLWHSVPILDFDMKVFHSSIPHKSNWDTRKLFVKFVTQTLLHRPFHFPLGKFKLLFSYKNNESIRSYVYSWLHLVILSKVAEIDLDFVSYRHPPHSTLDSEDEDDGEEEDDDEDDIFNIYMFDFSDLQNSSVQVLKLRGCALYLPSSVSSMKFDFIREIYLEEFPSTDEEIEQLIASCANLEVLSLVEGGCLQNLKIVSQKLKHFKLLGFNVFEHEETTIEICAPRLESIDLAQVYNGKYAWKDASTLVAADVKFPERSWWEFTCWANVVSFLSGVQRLTIQNMWTWFLVDPKKESAARSNGRIKRRPKGEGYENRFKLGDETHIMVPLGEEIFSESFGFHNLKHLELLTGYFTDDILGLEILLRQCPQLVTMVLDHSFGSYLDEDSGKGLAGRPIVLQMPHLRLVKMKNFWATKNEVYVVHLLKKYGVVLEKIVAFLPEVDGTSRSPLLL